MVALGALLAGAGQARAQELELDRVIAVINHDVVLASELERRMVQQTTTKNASDPRRAMLWAMIDERLLAQRGRAVGFTTSEKDVDAAVDAVRKQNNLTKEQLLAELGKVGYSLDDYRDSVARQLLVHRVLNLEIGGSVAVSDAEIKALYDKRVAAADGAETARLEDVKEALRAEIRGRKLDLARDRLLVELRAAAFIDIRLPAPAPAAKKGGSQ